MTLTDSSGAAMEQMNGYVTISMPLPEGLSTEGSKTIVVYRVDADGNLKKCSTSVENGILRFMTNHFSTYVIAEEIPAADNKTGNKSPDKQPEELSEPDSTDSGDKKEEDAPIESKDSEDKDKDQAEGDQAKQPSDKKVIPEETKKEDKKVGKTVVAVTAGIGIAALGALIIILRMKASQGE